MKYRLKSERVGKGILQKDFAKELGISTQYLCSIEKGRVEPRRDLMMKIALALNLDVQELFFDEKEVENND